MALLLTLGFGLLLADSPRGQRKELAGSMSQREAVRVASSKAISTHASNLRNIPPAMSELVKLADTTF